MAGVQLETGVAGGEVEGSSHGTAPETLQEEELGGVANIKLKQFHKQPFSHLKLLGTGLKQTLHPTPQLAQFSSGFWLYKYLSLCLHLW